MMLLLLKLAVAFTAAGMFVSLAAAMWEETPFGIWTKIGSGLLMIALGLVLATLCMLVWTMEG